MDPGLAALLGAAIGGLIALSLAYFQRRHDTLQRREERRFERLSLAALNLRLSLAHATNLDYSRSWRATINPTVWEHRWLPFTESVASCGAAMALVVDEVPRDLWDTWVEASAQLGEAGRSDRKLLTAYMAATKALSAKVEERARRLAGQREQLKT